MSDTQPSKKKITLVSCLYFARTKKKYYVKKSQWQKAFFTQGTHI